jgi:hypothetical protein
MPGFDFYDAGGTEEYTKQALADWVTSSGFEGFL